MNIPSTENLSIDAEKDLLCHSLAHKIQGLKENKPSFAQSLNLKTTNSASKVQSGDKLINVPKTETDLIEREIYLTPIKRLPKMNKIWTKQLVKKSLTSNSLKHRNKL